MKPEYFWENVKKKNPFMRASDVAKIALVSVATASRWMSKGKAPSAIAAIAIARELGCDPSELFVSEAKA